jgi:AmiR/NasT family two-component response regulator
VEDGSNRRYGAFASTEDGAAADAEITRLAVYADLQERKASELQATVSQLQGALDSRVVIDRALGMLAERFQLPIPEAFELLRAAARDSRREARAIAEEITTAREKTPAEIVSALDRRS